MARFTTFATTPSDIAPAPAPLRVSRRAALLGLAAAATPAALPSTAVAAPRSELIDAHWKTLGSVEAVDHSVWAAFLAQRLSNDADGVARLDYGAVSDAETAAVKAYVAALESVVATTLSPNAAYAYWVNLYNALTVKLVLEAYPVSSIKRVRGGLFGTGPWREKVSTVEGRALSLDDIEHGILRPVFQDPRIHYAVNCAATGCPNLQPEPFEGDRLDAQLDAAARDYVNHPRGARIDGRGRLIVSSIYEWFKEDFGGDDAGVIAHMKTYAEPELAAALEGVDRIYDDAYDWSLNDAGTA